MRRDLDLRDVRVRKAARAATRNLGLGVEVRDERDAGMLCAAMIIPLQNAL